MFIVSSTSFSLNISDKTASWIISSCSAACWKNVDGILHTTSTTIVSLEFSYPLVLPSYLAMFSDDRSSSAIILILLKQWVPINFLFWTAFLLSAKFLCLLSLEDLNLQCLRVSCFQLSYCFNFLDAMNAAYREKGKAHDATSPTRLANSILKNISYPKF